MAGLKICENCVVDYVKSSGTFQFDHDHREAQSELLHLYCGECKQEFHLDANGGCGAKKKGVLCKGRLDEAFAISCSRGHSPRQNPNGRCTLPHPAEDLLSDDDRLTRRELSKHNFGDLRNEIAHMAQLVRTERERSERTDHFTDISSLGNPSRPKRPDSLPTPPQSGINVGDENIIHGNMTVQSQPNVTEAPNGPSASLSVGNENVIKGDLVVHQTTVVDSGVSPLSLRKGTTSPFPASQGRVRGSHSDAIFREPPDSLGPLESVLRLLPDVSESLVRRGVVVPFERNPFPVNGTKYLKRPFVDGESVREIVERDGPIDHGRVLSILKDVNRILLDNVRSKPLGSVTPGNVIVHDRRISIVDVGLQMIRSSFSGAAPQAHESNDLVGLGQVGLYALGGTAMHSGDQLLVRERYFGKFGNEPNEGLVNVCSKAARGEYGGAVNLRHLLDRIFIDNPNASVIQTIPGGGGRDMIALDDEDDWT